MSDSVFIEHRQKDRQVAALLQSQVFVSDGPVKFSQYVYAHDRGNDVWLFHMLTKQVVSVPAAAYASLAIDSPIMLEHAPALAKQLFEQYYLVNMDLDEDAFYLELLEMLEIAFPQPEGVEAYTIIPTTACNARCFYCFEAGFAYDTMADETIEATVNYILAHKPEDGEVQISWFGGEPLLGCVQIRRICERLDEAGVAFSSAMITNGMLFDDAMIEEAKDKWHLKKVQITLDGFEEEHNRRKNVRDPHVSAYRLTRESIDLLVASGIRVSIRLNCDRNNFEEVKTLRIRLAEEYGDNEFVSTYLAPLVGKRGTSDYLRFAQELVCWDAAQPGCKAIRTSSLSVASLRRRYCMADDARAVVIGTKGELYDCEHINPERQWGTVFDGCTSPDIYKRMKAIEPVSQKCKGCMFLPICTTFSNCPDGRYVCKEAFEAQISSEAELLIEGFLGSDAMPNNASASIADKGVEWDIC